VNKIEFQFSSSNVLERFVLVGGDWRKADQDLPYPLLQMNGYQNSFKIRAKLSSGKQSRLNDTRPLLKSHFPKVASNQKQRARATEPVGPAVLAQRSA
jgi:hypothetical protein